MLRPALVRPALLGPALLLAAAAALLTACNSSERPPGDVGVCYHVAEEKGGKLKYNVVVRNMPNLENCAARLEALREQFLRMGGNRMELVGAFQTSYLFVDRTGVRASPTLTGIRYQALVRTGDGRLAVPGAMPDPSITPPPDTSPATPAAPPAATPTTH